MRRAFEGLCLCAVLLASCSAPASPTLAPEASGRQIATAPQSAVPEAATSLPRAEAIRFALVGSPVKANVWSLFDESGASYANYALRSGEYPSLYRLSVPAGEFEPYLAEGMPSAVSREGEFLTATVRLRPGLTWSDGSPLTAKDVAFTANSALKFRLGFDWLSAYDPGLLDRVEAQDDLTVKFFFKKPFTVGDWQYGALQGPVLSQAYWSPRLAEAETLLPASGLTASLDALKAGAARLQTEVDADQALLLSGAPGSESYKETEKRIKNNQEELNSVNTKMGKLQDEYDAALKAAHTALFALEDAAEPTFGPFLRGRQAGNEITRELNPAYPFQKPNYDRAVYLVFPDVKAALVAFEQGRVDEVLSLEGVAPESGTTNSPTSSLRFLVFNPQNNVLNNAALRQALACLRGLNETAQDQVDSSDLDGFVPEGLWRNGEVSFPCSGSSGDQRIQATVQMMRDAGYTWSRPPEAGQPGEGLTMPGGAPFPALRLLAPSAEYDSERARAATLIGEQAGILGIPLAVQLTDPGSLRYAVYSSGEYDMAILGWRLSAYPADLCAWFQGSGPFALNNERLKTACQAMESTADLGTARAAANEIQAFLMEKLPFIPLYQVVKHEAVRNVSYPFGPVLDGLSGLYGAPWLAMPVQ